MLSIIFTAGRSTLLFSILIASVPLACGPGSAPEEVPAAPRAEESAADPVPIEAEPLTLLSFDPSHDRIDQLRWRAGFEVRSSHPSLGGLSGLILRDGHLMAVSDRGHWWISPLQIDAAGTLLAIEDGTLLPILGPDGKPVEGRFENDAEEISTWRDGLVVGFEGEHRLH
ncbi:MAG: hypothetical protein MI919_42005, partial [Holophagales bacterium]|nr:hypothetical protein [Holophagales bacterium]